MGLPRDSRRYRLKVAALGLLGALFLRALGRTWRIETSGPDPFGRDGPVVGALWHRGLLVAAYRFRDLGVAVPVSQSRDGDLIDAVLRRLGFAPSPRGSSSRGASALLRGMIRLARAGHVVAVLPDGPRGPAGVAKPGVVALARAARAALVPVAISARPAIRFGSWDETLLPIPFARVRCVYGAPIGLPKRSGGELEPWRRELEARLHSMSEEADRELGLARAAAAGEARP